MGWVHWKRGGSNILPAIVFEYRVQVCLARNGDTSAGLVNVNAVEVFHHAIS
jgi:hypothetical protein